MHDWQHRVVIEKAQLDEKIDKLRGFLRGDHFSKVAAAECSRLEKQLHHMENYSSVLGERIKAFEE